jgi:hypothetical protein
MRMLSICAFALMANGHALCESAKVFMLSMHIVFRIRYTEHTHIKIMRKLSACLL